MMNLNQWIFKPMDSDLAKDPPTNSEPNKPGPLV